MVIRMRIYESQHAHHVEADRIFYQEVKPVHETHGAVFLGRYRDESQRVIVMWGYNTAADLQRIQQAVAQDPATQRNKAKRLKSGLHGCTFQEFHLFSTDPQS